MNFKLVRKLFFVAYVCALTLLGARDVGPLWLLLHFPFWVGAFHFIKFARVSSSSCTITLILMITNPYLLALPTKARILCLDSL
jgi:hypothetical protein